VQNIPYEHRFPIGEFIPPDSVTDDQVAVWIDQIEALPGQLARLVSPLTQEQLDTGRLYPEVLDVGEGLCTSVQATRSRGGRVIAVGTTVVRGLETAARDGGIQPFSGETELFVRPGYTFNVVDAMLTNFHLPESSLLMLVCAFGGSGRVLAAYEHAVRAAYRFYSYGDAMFLDRVR